MSCQQCEGCAYKPGAAANKEINNRLRGVICALGGMPFFCHDSLAWNEATKKYEGNLDNNLAVLINRNAFLKLGADPVKISEQVEETRRNLRLCGGWKRSVARLKESGWFANAEVNQYRRYMAKRFIQAINDFLDPLASSADKDEFSKELRELVEFFAAESKESKIDIRWLLGDEADA